MAIRIYIHQAITGGQFPNKYTVYVIHVYSNGTSLRVQRRYRDIRRLFKVLRERFLLSNKECLAEDAFPKKQPPFLSMTKDCVESRIRLLNELFRKWTDDLDIAFSAELLEFAGVRQARSGNLSEDVQVIRSSMPESLVMTPPDAETPPSGDDLFRRLTEAMGEDVYHYHGPPSPIVEAKEEDTESSSLPIGNSEIMQEATPKLEVEDAAAFTTPTEDVAKIDNSILCPILARPMHDAVVLVPCGHSFSDEGISQWLDSKVSCPICRVDVICRMPNYSFRELIASLKKAPAHQHTPAAAEVQQS